MTKDEMMVVLRGLLREVMKARFEGGLHARMTRAQGLADGYMRALLDAGVVTQQALLSIVANERASFIADDDTARATTSALREQANTLRAS